MNFVRVASPEDAPAIAALQCDIWRHDYPQLFAGAAGDELNPTSVAERWSPVLRGEIPGFVLVATSQDHVVGFAAIDIHDDQAQVHALLVSPPVRRLGHGSRLMSACADLAQQNGAREAVMWCLKSDSALRQFVESSGWAVDGGYRELSDEHAVVAEVRYATSF
jgi:GNAT superfamily N-acetyltransferase